MSFVCVIECFVNIAFVCVLECFVNMAFVSCICFVLKFLETCFTRVCSFMYLYILSLIFIPELILKKIKWFIPLELESSV